VSATSCRNARISSSVFSIKRNHDSSKRAIHRHLSLWVWSWVECIPQRTCKQHIKLAAMTASCSDHRPRCQTQEEADRQS
jgi:hypothetical protein